MNFLSQLKQQRSLRKVTAPTEATLQQRIGNTETTPERNTSYDEIWQASGALSDPSAPNNIKVLVLQRNCVSPAELDDILTKSFLEDNRKVDFVILPEGAHHEGGQATLEANQHLRQLAKIIGKHAVWACLGTMGETILPPTCSSSTTPTPRPTHHHCSALIVGPTGELCCTYKKRATMGITQTPGTEPCVFQTEFGLVGVLICYDAEHPQYVQETLDLNPILILNPVHISAGALRTTSERNMRNHAWRTSMESMGRHVDRIVSKRAEQGKSLSWIRCDMPYPIGAGTSQITEPCRTQHVPTYATTNWTTLVQIQRESAVTVDELDEVNELDEVKEKLSCRSRWICRQPKRDRTNDLDNCGNRYTLKSMQINSSLLLLPCSSQTQSNKSSHTSHTNTAQSSFEGKDVRQQLILIQENEVDSTLYPKGVVHVISFSDGQIHASIDLHRMIEIHSQHNYDIHTLNNNKKVNNNMHNNKNLNTTTKHNNIDTVDTRNNMDTTIDNTISAEINDRFFVEVGGKADGCMRLMMKSTSTSGIEGEGVPALNESLDKSLDKSLDECRHVFVGPAEGIVSLIYTGNVLVTLSERNGASNRNLLMQELDGATASGTASVKGGKRGRGCRRVVTVWEFSQNRIPTPLHELLF